METVENENESRKRGKWFIFVVLVLCGSVAAMVMMALGEAEPRYEGKLLSDWAAQYGTNRWRLGESAPLVKEAIRVIQEAGTDTIPFFLKKIQARDSGWKETVRERIPSKWHGKFWLVEDAEQQRRNGSYGLAALGDAGAVAVPELIRIAREHPDQHGRYMAVFTIRNVGRNSDLSVPFMIECLTNEVWTIRDEAALALGYLESQPKLAVPALVEHLRRGHQQKALDETEIRDTLQSLRLHGKDARAAFNLVTNFLGFGRS